MDVVLIAARAGAGAITLLVLSASCSSTTSSPAPTADAGSDAAPDASFKSDCGKPGDPGNSLGVGKFCEQTIADCGGNSKARLCTTLDPQGSANFFCTFRCDPTKDPTDVCGAEARCACNGDGSSCGCFPTRCDGPSSDAGRDAPSDGASDAATASDATLE